MQKTLSTTANKQVVVWEHSWIFELSLAHKLKIDLFPDCEVRNMDQLHLYDSKDMNIVIYAFFFHESSNDPKEDFSWADMVIHYTNELIVGPWSEYTERIKNSLNNSKFITIASGHRDCYDYDPDRAYLNLQHFFTTLTSQCSVVNHTLPTHKDKYFDVLLGTAKSHRVFVLENILSNGIENKCLINMTQDIYCQHGYNDIKYSYRSSDIDQYEDPAVISKTTVPGDGSMTAIKGMLNGYNLSQSIPANIYRNSWYSMVAETNPSNSTFFTEKTAKCLLAKRVFIFFGSRGQLATLREQGYKTFDSVIDESYDLIKDDQARWTAAFKQVLWLMAKDPTEVYNRLDRVLEHNRQLVCDQANRLNKIKKFINTRILKEKQQNG